MRRTPSVILAIGALALCIVIAALTYSFFARHMPRQQAPVTVVNNDAAISTGFTSETYGFTFLYPRVYAVKAYTPKIIEVGAPMGEEAFDSVAGVAVVTDADYEAESFDAMVRTYILNLCAADGPTGSVTCDAVSSEAPYVSAAGLSGTEYMLDKVTHSFKSGTSSHEAFGPIFAFNISANVREGRFAALVVHPPRAISPAASSTAVTRMIASSLRIDKTSLQTGLQDQLGLITKIERTATGTVVWFDRVDRLEGSAAFEAVASDTPCSLANAADCVETLNNGFYMRNVDKTAVPYPLGASAELTRIVEANTAPASIDDLISLLKDRPHGILATISTNGGLITKVAEVYMP